MIPPLYLRFIPSACAGVPTCATAPRRAAGLSSPIPRRAWPRMAWPCRTPARRVRQSRTGASAARIGARGYTTLTNVGEKPSRNVRRTPRVARCHKIVTRFGGLNRLGMAIYGRNETDGSWPRRTRSEDRQVGRTDQPCSSSSSSRPMRIRARDPSAFARAGPREESSRPKLQYYAMTKNNNPLSAI